jgi:uncharacterized protein YgiM (DUF1202 family)
MKHHKLISIVLALVLVVSGCAAMTEEQKANLSKITGGVIGGVAAEKLTDHIDNDAVRAAAIFAGAVAGAYIGDQFAKALSKRDQEKLFVAQQQAVSSGKPATFTGDNGVTGRVSVVSGQSVDQEEKTVKVKVLKDRVEQTPPLELVGAPYSPKNVVNVRSGPGTDYKTVAQLAQNQSVQVIGEALPGKKWFLISQLPDGTAGGYVYSSLMAPSSKPVEYVQTSSQEVAEVNVQASGVCKTVRQEVTTNDGTISEDLRVCQQGDGTWKLA